MAENVDMQDSITPLAGNKRAERGSTIIRVAVFWVSFFGLLIGLQHLQLAGLGSAAPAAAAGIIMLVMLPLILRLLKTDGRTLSDIGLHPGPRAPLQFAVGLGLGLLVVSIMIGILLLLTPLEIGTATYDNLLLAIAPPFITIFVLALMEEIVFRSYPLFRLRDGLGIRPAVYLSSVVFAFYHGLAFENLLGPGVWGLFYAWMAFATRSIALPTGFHFGLNWMQSLLGMKPRYGDSLWELSIAPGQGIIETETVGLAMQVVLLVIGVVLVERFIARQSGRARS